MGEYIIIGGAGFIGCNLARRLVDSGQRVVVFDNASRAGVEHNVAWLRSQGVYTLVRGDLRQRKDVEELFAAHRQPAAVFHLAAQVAVTTSVRDPRLDFEVNALGTLNMLEAVRQHCDPHAYPTVVYSSTNKVYGGLEALKTRDNGERYEYCDVRGVSEENVLDFHSPYGCSKGAADQYVRDYQRIYGIPTVVLRQSCIYGPQQFGNEDQGWVAHFARAALLDKPLTIYGDGKQVRDLLYIDDLVDCFLRCHERIDTAAGEIYNVGGGPEFQASLREVIRILEGHFQTKLRCSFADWRPGDQRCYVSDLSKIGGAIGWQPRVDPPTGIGRLCDWMQSQRQLLETAA
jgi:CDP-paratose 2-epimerase